MSKSNKESVFLDNQTSFLNKLIIFVVIFVLVISFLWYFKLNLYFTDKYSWYIHMGNKYHSIGEEVRALQYAKKAIRIDPERPEARHVIIKVYMTERKFEKAKKELILLKELGESSIYYRYMGLIMREQDMIDESLHFFKKGIEKDAYSAPNHVSVRLRIGVSIAYLKLNDTENAFKYLNQGKDLAERSYQDDPLRKRYSLAKIHAGLGFAYQKKGLHQKAEEEFKISESFKPGSVQYVFGLIT